MANSEWRIERKLAASAYYSLSLLTIRYSLNPFNNRCGTHPGADAQRDERGGKIAPFEFVEHRAEDHGAGRAERMSHRDGAAVDVHLGVVEIERLHVAQHHRRERFVELDQIDIVDGHAGLLEHLAGDVDRAGKHDRGLRADVGERLDARARLQARAPPRLLAADQHRGGA